MKFYRLRDIPRLPNDVVFLESSRKQGLFFLIFLTLSAGMAFLGSSGGIHGGEFELPSVLAYSIGVVMGVLALVALVGLRAGLKREESVHHFAYITR